MLPTNTNHPHTLSALEIVTKLCSPDFARKAKAADFHIRAWDVFIHSHHSAEPASSASRLDKDKILSTILAFFTALIASDSTSLVELAHAKNSDKDDTAGDDKNRRDFVGTLVEFLDSGIGKREKDALELVGAGVGDTELKRAGIGRTEKALVSTSCISRYCPVMYK